MTDHNNKTTDQGFSLTELSREVERLLEAKGLAGETDDYRVSAAPDERTIRYYTTLGLLDRPAIENRAARYFKKHLIQLVAIKALQHQALSLADIQKRLYGRSIREIESLIESMAEAKRKNPAPPAVVVWEELVVEPGFKILLSGDAVSKIDIEHATAKVKTLLHAHRKFSERKERS